jgi:hypothetical protein
MRSVSRHIVRLVGVALLGASIATSALAAPAERAKTSPLEVLRQFLHRILDDVLIPPPPSDRPSIPPG